MKQLCCNLMFILLLTGCDTLRYFSADRTDKEKREQLEKDRLRWEIKNAEMRYQAGNITRADYNRIRRKHGLPAAD